MQGRNRDVDAEKRHVDMAGKGRVGWKGRTALAYVHTACEQLVGTCYSAGSSAQCSVTTQMGDGGGRSVREGISVHMELIHVVYSRN